MPGQPEGKKKIWNSVTILNWFAFSTHKIDLMGKIIYFTFEKNQTQKISDQILEENWGIFSQAQKPLDFNSKVQKIDKVVKDKCPFDAHCPMGNARATKFLKGHCPTLPMPLFFLMGIAQICLYPNIFLNLFNQTQLTKSKYFFRLLPNLNGINCFKEMF